MAFDEFIETVSATFHEELEKAATLGDEDGMNPRMARAHYAAFVAHTAKSELSSPWIDQQERVAAMAMWYVAQEYLRSLAL